jgi:hypothetical protein
LSQTKAENSEAGALTRRWPLLFIFATALLFTIHAFSRDGQLGRTARVVDLAYGFTALFSVAILFAYWIRANVYSRRLGSRHGWYVSHLYIGVLLVWVVCLHSGLRLTGLVSGGLLILFLGATASGALGAVMYVAIPLRLSKSMGEAVTLQDLTTRLDKIRAEADGVAQKAPVLFMELYTERLRRAIVEPRWIGRYLTWNEKETVIAAEEYFDKLRRLTPEGSAHDMEILRPLFVEKETLSFRIARLQILRAWLDIHLPLATALLAGSVIHAISIARY